MKGDYSDILGGYNIHYTDTFSIFGYTKRIDTVFSSNSPIKFLGSHQDAVFGRTDASILTNFSIPNDITNVQFGPDPYLVHAELLLTVNSPDFTGDITKPLQYDVYLLQQPLAVNGYYSTKNYSLSSNVKIGTYTGTFTTIGNKQGIRIPIDYAFANSILTNTSALVNSEALQSTYKGFYITCKNSNLNPTTLQGHIASFNLNHPGTGMVLYYKPNGNNPLKEVQTFTFTFDGRNAKRVNEVEYNPFMSSDLQLQKQLQGDTAFGANHWFLKGMNGTRIRIYVPHLENLKKFGKILISRAELSVYIDQNKNPNTSPAPLKLALLASDSLGREKFTADQMSSFDFVRYGGDFISSEGKYVFNIPREIQQIVDGKRKNHGFWLVIANPERAFTSIRDHDIKNIVLGGHTSNKKARMVITFAIPK
ncbi:MAG: DUF4270 domain-containing protein [Bacteroidia bacterium]|nr:DUF4270 domain-containing protein [Bacteroidia bacterium]